MTTLNYTPLKPIISVDVLDKVDIRVDLIERVEEMLQSNRLVSYVVDFGDHRRNILAGLKQERTDPQAIEVSTFDSTGSS